MGNFNIRKTLKSEDWHKKLRFYTIGLIFIIIHLQCFFRQNADAASGPVESVHPSAVLRCSQLHHDEWEEREVELSCLQQPSSFWVAHVGRLLCWDAQLTETSCGWPWNCSSRGRVLGPSPTQDTGPLESQKFRPKTKSHRERDTGILTNAMKFNPSLLI